MSNQTAYNILRDWKQFTSNIPKVYYRNERMKIGFEFKLGDDDFKSELSPMIQALNSSVTAIKNVIKEVEK